MKNEKNDVAIFDIPLISAAVILYDISGRQSLLYRHVFRIHINSEIYGTVETDATPQAYSTNLSLYHANFRDFTRLLTYVFL